MSLADKIVTSARRASKPYEVHARSVAVYTAILFLLFVLLSAARLKLAGPDETLGDFGVSLIDNLSAAVVAAMVAALLLFFLFPKVSLAEELIVLDAWNIGPALKAPLSETQNYHFRGRSGRWIRTTVLPALFEAASRDSVTRTAHLLLPDPRDSNLLQAYANYRNSLPSGKKDPWTSSRIRNEILATLLQAGRLTARSSFFETHIVLLSEFALLRADLSDTRLVLTREEAHLPGWMSTAGSKFYASYLEEMRMALRRGHAIDWKNYVFPSTFGEADVASAVQAFGLGINLAPDDTRDILKAMESRDSPYA